MIYYNPIDGDPFVKPVAYSPRSCFVMTKLGNPIPRVITEIRDKLSVKLKELDLTEIDASSMITGRDFLLKIWKRSLLLKNILFKWQRNWKKIRFFPSII